MSFLTKTIKDPKIYYVKSNRFPIFRGFALPYVGIIIKEEYKDDEILIKHETIHLRQIRRMTFPVYIIRYLTQLIFIGYDAMPIEIEARQHEPTPWITEKEIGKDGNNLVCITFLCIFKAYEN